MAFVHLHNHSEYSLLDGAMKLDWLVDAAARMKMNALALTDHGGMFGAVEFYKLCQKAGIKPIIGAETYIAPGSRLTKGRTELGEQRVPESSFHLILLATNIDGYKNLIKLLSQAYLDGFYYKPRIDRELLSGHAKGLIGMSACLKGEIPYYLRTEQSEKARETLATYLDILGRDNFYLELMRMGLREQVIVNRQLVELAQEFDVPVVATNDCHYLTREDSLAHDVLLCIQTKKVLTDKERLKFETKQAYFRSPEEMGKIFKDLPEAVTNTLLVSERCNLLLNLGGKELHLPNYPRPQNYATDFDYLKYLTLEGLKKRFPRPTQGLEDRLQYELEVIRNSGLAGYFLTVKEIVDFARAREIPVGPGRGSAVGSLVLYCLSITDIDPTKYGLIFERFLNPERVSMPDIDSDFGDTRRDEVISFIKERYGEKNVSQVVTFGTMQAKAVIRDVGRVLSIPYSDVDRLAKVMPMNQSIRDAMAQESEFKKEVLKNQQFQQLVEIAKRLEGLARHVSLHAAGVVITPRELTEFVPIYKSPDRGEVSTQYDMISLEEIGLLKMDILGLRTLTVIQETLKKTGLDKGKINIDDLDTYKLLQEGRTVGVFQLESRGMREILTNLKPEAFRDLIAVIALYRPGPLGTANIPNLIKYKHNPSLIPHVHPVLDDVMKETYGIILYQEQVMKIANVVAGFSMAEADTLRRAMGKKIPELMDAMKEKFIEGAKRRKFDRALATQIFEMIAPFAGYGFNKSHAAAYAQLAFETAFLKAHYPVEFMVAALNSEIDDTDRLGVLTKEARQMQIETLPPDINESGYEFAADTGNGRKIRYGLGALKNVGRPASLEIVGERSKGPFKGFFDFVARVNHSRAARVVNRKCIESLIKAGGFDSLSPNRVRLLHEMNSKDVKAEKQTSLFTSDAENELPDWPRLERIAKEKEVFGFYFSGHPLEKYATEYSGLKVTKITELLAHKANKGSVTIGGVIVSFRVKRDKKNKEYAIILLEDFEGTTEAILFSDLYQRVANHIQKDALVLIKGRIDGNIEDKAMLRAEMLVPFSEARNYLQHAVIDLDAVLLDDAQYKRLLDVLVNNPGPTEVWLTMRDKNGKERMIRSRSFKILPSSEVIEKVKEVTGSNGIHLSGEI